MTARAASQTALMVAALRGRASRVGLCADPWGSPLAGPEGEALADRYLELFPHFVEYMGVRTAFLDEVVLRAQLEAPFMRQIVVLGAGLDTRAARLARPGVRFFEVDQPASQADKRTRLAALSGYPADAATFVSCDFEHQDFVERLVAARFDLMAPALFLWEGVSYYLGEEAVRATLSRIADGCHAGSAVVFDYVMKNIIEGRRLRPHHVASVELLASLSEPFRWGTNDPIPLLAECGFRHVRATSFDEACLTLTGTYDRAREFRFQQLCLASRARLGWAF